MGTLHSVYPSQAIAVWESAWNDRSLEPNLPSAYFAHLGMFYFQGNAKEGYKGS